MILIVSCLNRVKWLFLFWIINALFAGVISINYFRFLSIDFSLSGIIFCILTTIGHFFMLALLGSFFLVFPWSFFSRGNKIAAILSFIVCLFGVIVLLADTFVFGLYRYHIYNKFVLDLVFGGGAGGIFIFTQTQIFLISCAILAIIGIEFFFIWLSGKIAIKISRAAIWSISSIFIVALIGSHLMHAYFSASGGRDVYQIAAVYPGYFPLTANRFLIRHGFVDPEKVREKIKMEMGKSLDYPRKELIPFTQPTKNILVVFIDSWNFRTFEPETMPNVCNFAEKAQVFLKHYSGDHGTRTGVPSFFHGLPGLYYNTIRDGGVSSAFIDVLVKNGYEMGIFATAGLSNPPFNRTIFANVPVALNDRFSEKFGGVPEGDIAITDAWIEWLKKYETKTMEDKKPFFGFLFYDELHAMSLPKDAEKKFPTDWTSAHYERLGKNTDPTPFWNLYKNDAYWLDKQLKRVFEDLYSRGFLENTIVILTGDHGQEFNESGANFWGHGSAFSPAQLHVPFILFDAQLRPKKFSHWTAHYDASVTLLQNYLNIKNPSSDYSIGKNLFDETPREWLLVGHPEQFGVLEKDRITHVQFDKTYEIYDYSYKIIPEAKLNIPVFHAALEQAKTFYKK